MTNNGVHRVVVVDEKQVPSNVITQSRLVKLADAVIDGVPSAHKSLEALGLDKKGTLVAVGGSSTVRDAFAKMDDQKVSGVAVINDKGVIIGSISHTDLRSMGYDMSFFGLLAGSCQKFIEHLQVYDAKRPIPPRDDPVTVTKGIRLGDVVKLLNYYGIHRVFVVDENKRPSGVLTMTDVLAQLLVDET